MTNLHELRVSLGNALVTLFAVAWLIVFLSQTADVVSSRYITNTGIYVSLSPDETLVVDGVLTETPQEALAALFDSGDARLTKGTPEVFARFFSYFEAPNNEPISITLN